MSEPTCNMIELRDVINRHGGKLSRGSHEYSYSNPDCPLCILEAVAACRVERGLLPKITDSPIVLGLPDIRPINDAAWSSDEVRTEHMVRLYEAYVNWDEWSDDKQIDVVTKIAIATVGKLIAQLPYLPDDVVEQCKGVESLSLAHLAACAAGAAASVAADDDTAGAAADAAARAAAACAAADALAAARAAADAADDAADALADADKVLITAIDLWVDAAQTGTGSS